MSPTRPHRARRALARGVATLTVACGALALPATTVAAAPTPPGSTAPVTSGPTPPKTQVPQSYLVADADTGQIVAATNEHVPHLTASTIKVLTALVAVEQLPASTPIHVSRLAAAQPAMRIDMKEGSTWPMDQALASLLMVSANDAAYALAENTGGSLGGFAAMANREAKRLGMKDTTFTDPAGLDGAQGFGGGTTSSAYDLAVAARNALTVPEIAADAAKVRYEFTDPNGVGRRLTNHNRGFLTSYPGAIGLKTGFTKAASRTLLAAARRDGHTCVAAVMGTWDDTGWAGYLLDQCFAGVRLAGAPPLPATRVRLASATTPRHQVVPVGALGATPPAPPSTATVQPTGTSPTAKATTATATPSGAPKGSADSGSSFGTVLRYLGLLLLGLLVVGFVLRRRAVKRQRERRLERVRAHQEARRRRMIDIVGPDAVDGALRVLPNTTDQHVSASPRRSSDHRTVRPTRPRDRSSTDRS